MAAREVPFTELLSHIIDNRGRTCPISDSGMPLIATNCVRNDLLYPAYDKVRYVSKETYANWFRGHPEPGDLIFVCKGSPGRVCLTPDPVGFCIAQDMVAVRADPTKVYPRFLFAALRSDLIQQRIVNMHVGTLIPHFKKGDFDKLLVPLPDYGTQTGIGDLYFTLSAKIELNRRMNATLEGISRVIFKSWFVDFDPVRQKVAGKQPVGMDAQTAALFPDSFENSEIGEVPTGWGVRPINECFSIVDGATFRAEDRVPNSQIVAYGANGPVGFCSRANVHGPCIVLGKIGSCGSLHRSWSPCWVTNNAFTVSAGPAKSLEYTWQTIKGIDFAQYIGGSANPYMPLKNFRHHATLMPPEFLLDAYQRKVANQATLVAHHYQEAATLAALRDTLLPKLLSGEVRVPEAEGMVEEAVR